MERMGRIIALIFANTPYRHQNDLGSRLLVGLTLGIRVVPYQGLSKRFILFAGRKIRHLMIPFTNLFTGLTQGKRSEALVLDMTSLHSSCIRLQKKKRNYLIIEIVF